MRIKIRISILSAIFFLTANYSMAVVKAGPEGGPIGTLTGTVTDKGDGKPIIGATVSVPDIRNGSITDVNGHYNLVNLPKGVYLVQVSYIGHYYRGK